MEGEEGKKPEQNKKHAAPTRTARMNGSTFPFIHSDGLAQGCAPTVLRSLFFLSFFFPSQRVAKRCVGRDCSDPI